MFLLGTHGLILKYAGGLAGGHLQAKKQLV